ncbi:MAG: transglutaminase domain-containing protein [Bacteroidetes bacterium]|nr:transglutaminase domain-containing protein [Bacteroidota bacterium]
MDKAVLYTDSVYSKNGSLQFDTAKYVHIISNFTKERFYHGLSNYNLSDNWIAYFLGKLLWSHFSAIVIPDDILKYPQGLCSQQTIIFMELLKRKGIKVRSVGLGYKEGPGHFLCEVYYGGAWRLYDVTKEPEWKKLTNKHLSMDYYLSNKDSLYLAYKSRMPLTVFNKLTERVNYGEVNKFPAEKMLLFHKITKALTYILPISLLFLAIGSYKKR